MTTSDFDIRFVKEAVPQLQEYLLSNELYWPLSGSLPRLTPGALLLALVRLNVEAPAEARALEAQVISLRSRWQTAWKSKAARELANRTRLWSQYLADFQSSPEQSQESYRNEVRGRAILQLLLAELPGAPESSTLAELDSVLRSRLVSGKFIWESELQPAFPSASFWFLYGSL